MTATESALDYYQHRIKALEAENRALRSQLAQQNAREINVNYQLINN